MTNQIQLDEFKQQVAANFNQRQNYGKGDFHPQLAHRLIEYAGIHSGQKILDIATGTGLVAIEAAQLVGSEGRVVGVDISAGMLNQARQTIEAAGLNNIEVYQVDAEALNFADNSFNVILCCSALIYLTNIPATLRQWHKFLKPNGLIGFNAFADTSFITSVVLKRVAQKNGVSLIFNQLTGTKKKCYALLQDAGFGDIEVKTDQFGSYISLSEAKGLWDINLKNPLCSSLQKLESKQLEQVKAEYFAELEALATNQGIWNDITTFSAFGRKRADS